MISRIRTILLLLLASISAQAGYAQLRGSVPVVKPVYSSEALDFLRDLGDSLDRVALNDAAAHVRSCASGSYGSGFVLIGGDGSPYVVTNAHVLPASASAIVQFEDETGARDEHGNNPIISRDTKLDLAIVKLADARKTAGSSLSFFRGSVADGLEVWSAGYPGLAGEPAWQLGKGNVTNGHARIPALLDPAISTLVQHSAQVDPGNSGGPLLVRGSGAGAGYEVVGVNTWKATGRQAMNFSIPAALVEAYVDHELSGAKPDPYRIESLEARCATFAAMVNEPNEDGRRFSFLVADDFVFRNGRKVLIHSIRESPRKISEELIYEVTADSPFDACRAAIAYSIATESSASGAGGGMKFLSCEPSSPVSKEPVKARFSCGGRSIESSWIFEDGGWRLASFPLDATGSIGVGEPEEPTSKKQPRLPYHVLLGLELGLDTTRTALSYGLSGALQLGPYVQLGPFARFARSLSPLAWDSSELKWSSSFDLGGQLRVGFPLVSKALILVPYLETATGYRQAAYSSRLSDSTRKGMLFECGAGFLVGLGPNPSVYFGGGGRYEYDTPEREAALRYSLWFAYGF
jgi:serine protease Do